MISSQLNNSISKQLYSFSKSNRFPKNPHSPCKQQFYDYKRTTLTNRATSFGYGNKVELASKQDIPPPGKYDRKGEFLQNINKKRGYSFSRHSKRQIINQEETKKVPGPGMYETDKDIKFSHLKYTFRSKFNSVYQKKEHDLGPGQYKTLEVINKEGHHAVAKFQDSQSRRFTRSPRFKQTSLKTPGPGTYNDLQKLSMNKTGSYFNSRFKSNFCSSFSRSNRMSLANRTFSPGPGKYQIFSEFNSTFR